LNGFIRSYRGTEFSQNNARVLPIGAGKTLALTYLAWRNYLKGKQIFTNYNLTFPEIVDDIKRNVRANNPSNIHRITRITAIEEMRDGFFAGV
jgi:hypothetical protein